jgi:hypothetical protein
MDYFRDHAVLDYFAAASTATAEDLLLVHGSVSRAIAPSFVDRLQRVAQDFAQQHQADQKMPQKEREGYTLCWHAQLGVLGLHAAAPVLGCRAQRPAPRLAEDREHARVAIQVAARDLAAGEESHQRHVTQRPRTICISALGPPKCGPPRPRS